ncbi:MAG: pseudouridine synthase [Candidatus Saccharimonadales bacterium]
MNEADTTRVNKIIAHAIGLSRREVDTAISAGRVTINGQKAVMGSRVRPGDTVLYDGKPITERSNYTYLLLNKPTGYVCSRKRQGDVPTIYELLEPEQTKLKAVGRLDKDSSGLLLLTDDGDFAHRMTHPKFHKQKTYIVALDKDLEPLHQQMISDHGIHLEDGPSKLVLEKLSDTDRAGWRVSMHEGRNRQIRRTFSSLGYEVTALHRTDFGPYSIGSLKPGTTIPTTAI